VSALIITDNRFLADPTIGIGAQVNDLIETLGEPEDRTDTAITYDCPDGADSPVVFRLDQNVVTAIEVTYYTG
jgi:hypothetical protein